MVAHHSRPSLAREQSLLRSFSAIHRMGDDAPRLSPVTPVNVESEPEEQVLRNKRDRLSPTRRAVTPTLPIVEVLPGLPFGRDEQQSEQRGSSRSRERPTKKFQRRRTSAMLTADEAQKMVVKLTNEKQYEQRRLQTIEDTPSSPSPNNKSQEHHRGFRKDYILGDTLRHPSHMIIEPTAERSRQAIESLQKHDFAFIKRSDGSFSYAILAYRSMVPIKGAENKNEVEETLIFVMSNVGSTKMVRKHHWNDFVRPVSVEETTCAQQVQAPGNTEPSSPKNTRSISPKCPPSLEQQLKQTSMMLCQDIPVAQPIPEAVVCQEIEINQENEDFVPDMIMFDKAEVADEECSLISSVSDRARMLTRRG